MKKSYWMWYYGDYEVYHYRDLNLRRQEFGRDYPTLWYLSSPYVSVVFFKEMMCDEDGYAICHANGKGVVLVDFEKRYNLGETIPLKKGGHNLRVEVFNTTGLPAAFVESNCFQSGDGWEASCRDGKFKPAGWHEWYDSKEKNPESFPFEYETKYPVSITKLDDGELYDFGKEMFGYIDVKTDTTSKFEVIYGETDVEALDKENATVWEDVSGATEYRLTQRAFRYIFIRHSEGEILSVSAEYEYLPLEYKGSFVCDNELINKIYEVSAYTFHLNSREMFLDGIKRDRWVWSGDAYQSGRINAYLFADKDIVKRTALGLIGKEPIMSHLNTIVDYSLLWIIGNWEYYFTYGDADFLKMTYPITQKLVDFCYTRLNEHGFIVGNSSDWTFIDWAEIDKTGAVCAEQMLLAACYDAMAEISSVVGADSIEFVNKKQNLLQKIDEFYWDDEKRAYIDSYESGNRNVTRHANIFAIMYDLVSEERKQIIIDNVINNPEIPQITTPYFKGYELDILGKLGRYDDIETMITSYWGKMIELGATSIWEEFDPTQIGNEHYAMYGRPYGKSLCHAWGAGSIYILGRYYLGVHPTSAGYRTFKVEPHLGGFKHFKGVVPAGDGEVRVSVDENGVCVLADIEGGTLVWNGMEYPIVPNVELNCK